MNDNITIINSQPENKKEQVIWEEKNLTEPEKNYSNSSVPEDFDITTIIGKGYQLNAWQNIINQRISGIYKIINKVNGKYYVGSAININYRSRGRWACHIRGLNGNYHYNRHLQSAWNKYGKEAFEFQIVETVPSDKTLILSTEQGYLDIAKLEQDKCYNKKFIAGGGEYISESGRNRISEYNRTRIFTVETRNKIGDKLRGQKRSDEIKKKQSLRAKIHYSNPENKAKLIMMNKRIDHGKVAKTLSDKTMYKFINTDTNEVFDGTKLEFRTKYNLRKTSVAGVVKHRRRSVSGWQLLDNSYVSIVGKNNKYKSKEEANYAVRKVKNRPSKEELLELVWNKSTIQVGLMYGVCKEAIRKWCIGYNIPVPPVGYWIKIKYGRTAECNKIKQELFNKFNLVYNFD